MTKEEFVKSNPIPSTYLLTITDYEGKETFITGQLLEMPTKLIGINIQNSIREHILQITK